MRKLVIRELLFAIAVILLMLQACIPALADSPLAPGPEDLPMDRAVGIAAGKFMAIGNVTEKELDQYTVQAELWPAEDAAPDKRAWTVVFYYPGRDDLFFSVRAASPSGKILGYGPETFAQDLEGYLSEAETEKFILEQTALWEDEKGPEYLWSYVDKASFYETYGYAAGYVYKQIPGLPGKEDISQQQAVELAREAVTKEFGVAKEQLETLLQDCTFLPQTHIRSDGMKGPIWLILFRDTLPDNRGIYMPLYQVSILSPQGEVDRVCDLAKEAEQDGQAMTGGAPQADAPVPEAAGTVYYNPRGGKYYHANQYCSKVSSQYLPLTALNLDQLKETAYKNLLPCPICYGIR